MQPSRSSLTLVAIALAAVTLGGCQWSMARYNRGHGVFTAPEGPQFEAVRDWTLKVDYSQPLEGYSDLAGYPVGNGQAFGATGLSYPLGTLEDLFGPTYDKAAAGYGQIIPALVVRGKVVPWRRQETGWTTGAGVVRTESVTAEGLKLTTFDFAPPDLPALARLMVVENTSGKRISGVGLSAAFNREPQLVNGEARLGALRAGFLESRAYLAEKTELPFTAKAPGTTAAKLSDMSRALICPLGTLRAGQSVGKLFYMIFTKEGDAGDQALAEIRKQGRPLETTAQYWSGRTAQTATVQTGDARLDGFFAVEKYLCQVQQAQAGGFSPMDRYSYCWIRDSNGPVRYLLACGDYEAVRRYLDYQYRGYAKQGKVSNNLTLALELPAQAAKLDWEKAPVPSAEIASFMILQRYWYWKHTADSALIREQWPMLRRCLLGQQVDERGTLPFFGDETYRFPGYELFQSGKPAPDWVHMTTRSLDSAMEYVVAAHALAEMAPVVARGGEAAEYRAAAVRVQAGIERYFRQASGIYAPAVSDFSDEQQQNPFAPINLSAWWLGYDQYGDRAALSTNYAQTLRYLMKPGGTVLSTPQVGYYVPLQLGFLLYAMADLQDPARDQALQGLLNAAEASGGFAEMNTPEDKPSAGIWGLHRFRPWEGGINAEAVFHALTGLEVDMPHRRVSLQPWLPEGKDSKLLVDGLRAGECHMELALTERLFRLMRAEDKDGQPLTVEAVFPAPVGKKQWVLEPGGKIELQFSPPLSFPRGKRPAAAPFTWAPPKAERPKPVVLLTWDAKTVAEQRAKYGGQMVALDTKIPGPLAYWRAYLFAPDGSRLARTVVTDTEVFAGAFKPADFWKAGEGKRLLDEFRKAGGETITLKTGRQPVSESHVPDV